MWFTNHIRQWYTWMLWQSLFLSHTQTHEWECVHINGAEKESHRIIACKVRPKALKTLLLYFRFIWCVTCFPAHHQLFMTCLTAKWFGRLLCCCRRFVCMSCSRTTLPILWIEANVCRHTHIKYHIEMYITYSICQCLFMRSFHFMGGECCSVLVSTFRGSIQHIKIRQFSYWFDKFA